MRRTVTSAAVLLCTFYIHTGAFGFNWIVSKVLTGETFIATEEEYRFRGIKAPLVEASREHLESLLSEPEIVVHRDMTRDSEGRQWGYFDDYMGRDIGGMMIRDGYALADLSYEYDRQEEYIALELEARRAGRGLWADSLLTARYLGLFAGDSLRAIDLRIVPSDSSVITTDTNVMVYTSTATYHLPGCWNLWSTSRWKTTLIDVVRSGHYRPCGMCNAPVLDTSGLIEH